MTVSVVMLAQSGLVSESFTNSKGQAVSFQFPPPATSQSLRRSLKRGLVRQAMSHAGLANADGEKVYATLREMNPNRIAMERMVLRLRRQKGVVCAAILAKSPRVVVIVRNVCETITRKDEIDLFAESVLLYTRVTAFARCGTIQCDINRATFCIHALERLVERGQYPIESRLLVPVDAEAVALLRADEASRINLDDDCYIRSIAPGVWAGSFDQTALEPFWGKPGQSGNGVPTF